MLFIFFALMGSGASLFSQINPRSIQFERIGGKEGLPVSEIKHIYQDSLGFLWLSSFGGLFRYDGHTFKVYKNSTGDPEGLFSNLVAKVCESSGRLWAITEYDRLHLFDAATDRFRPFKLHFEKGGSDVPVNVSHLLEDRHGVIWVATRKFGLCRLDPASGKLSRQPLHPGRTDETVTSILEDPQGNIWLCADGLFRMNPISVDAGSPEITAFPRLQKAYYFIYMIDKSGAIWMGNESSEVARFEPLSGETRHYYFYNNSSDGTVLSTFNHVTAMLEDRQGMIWVASNPSGISLFDPASGKVTILKYDRNDPQSLSYNAVTSLLEDRSGILWASTWGGGLSKHDPVARRFGHQRHFQTDPKSLGSPTASYFCETPDGSVWVISEIGLSKFKRQEGIF
ncbi:MAG: two-component regulator propeller domain-containing protein, partial [Bacteroidota bacterium]